MRPGRPRHALGGSCEPPESAQEPPDVAAGGALETVGGDEGVNVVEGAGVVVGELVAAFFVELVAFVLAAVVFPVAVAALWPARAAMPPAMSAVAPVAAAAATAVRRRIPRSPVSRSITPSGSGRRRSSRRRSST